MWSYVLDLCDSKHGLVASCYEQDNKSFVSGSLENLLRSREALTQWNADLLK